MTTKVLQIIKIFLQKRLTFYYFIQGGNSFNLCWNSFHGIQIKSPHITSMSCDPPWRAGSLSSYPLGLLPRRGAFMSFNIPTMSFEQLTLKRRRSFASSLNGWSFMSSTYNKKNPSSLRTLKRRKSIPHTLILGQKLLWAPHEALSAMSSQLTLKRRRSAFSASSLLEEITQDETGHLSLRKTPRPGTSPENIKPPFKTIITTVGMWRLMSHCRTRLPIFP